MRLRNRLGQVRALVSRKGGSEVEGQINSYNDPMPNTQHNTLVLALAHIDQLVATAQELAAEPDANATLRILALLKEMQMSMEVAEVALGAAGK